MNGNQESLKKNRFVIALIVFILVLVEVSSFAFVKFFLQPQYSQFFYSEFEGIIDDIPDTHIQAFRQNKRGAYTYDATLGWTSGVSKDGINTTGCRGTSWHFSTDALGSRSNPYPSDRKLISLYGGSYTYSAEVGDDGTWQYFLSQLTDTKVQNFGTGGYGMDQALLKLQRNLKNNIRTPIVILGVYSDGISRIISIYRPFKSGRGSGLSLGFKPILHKVNGEFQWMPNPLKSLDNRAEIHRAYEIAKEHDYWFAQNQRKPRAGFPYSWTVLEVAYFISMIYLPNKNLWKSEDAGAADVMREIIRRFVKLGKQEDYFPVVVFIPSLGDLERYSRGEKSQYQEFRELVERSYTEADAVVIDVFEEKLDVAKFTLPGCHPSVYGNKAIANIIFKRIAPIMDKLK